MTKTLIRVSAALVAFVLTFTILAVIPAVPNAAAASGEKPAFTIVSDREAANTGTKVIISMAVDNDTPDDITSFSGELRYDTRFFRYEGYEDQISMDGSVRVVADAAANGKLGFAYLGKELTNTRINSGDSVVFIKFIFSVITGYDTTGQFFVGTVNDCYYDTVNIGVIDCKAPSITVRSTTTLPPTTQPTASPTSQQLSGDARLMSLTVEGCTLSPAFNTEFVAYTASVPYEVTSVRIDAVTNASGAIASGLGIKDLNVGLNNFTVSVLAENGTIKEYGIVITRLEPTVPTETTSSTEPTESTAVPTESTEVPTTTAPITTIPSDAGNTIIDENDKDSSDDILQIVGIVFGEIALFFFGFLSGFFVDKNLRRKGERLDDSDYDEYDEYEDDEDDYDQSGAIYTPGNQVYPDGTYMNAGYQAMPQQYTDPPLVDPQLVQYNQFLQPPMNGEQAEPMYSTFQQQNPPVQPPATPNMGQPFGEQTTYPGEDGFAENYSGPYFS